MLKEAGVEEPKDVAADEDISGLPARKLGPPDHSSSFGQPTLGSVPLAPVSQIWAGFFQSPPETTGPELVPRKKTKHQRKVVKRAAQRDSSTNVCPDTKGEPKRAAQRDSSTSVCPNTKGEQKKAAQRDSSTSIGPNLNGGNQKSSSTETARPV